MTERTDEWPRVHTCLHDWCPRRTEECRRCDAVLALIKVAAARRTHGEKQPQVDGQ